jgi:hypothetical protein
VLLSGCAQPEVLAFQHDVYEVDGGVEISVSSGCDELPRDPGAGFGFGLGTAPGIKPVAYSISYEFRNDSVSMTAGATEGAPTQREYDAAFLSSGGEDDFFIELTADFGLHVINRAVPGGCALSN